MASFKFKVKGLDQLEKKFGPKGVKQILSEVNIEFKTTAQKVRNLAVKKVSVNTGFLRNSLNFESTEPFKWTVYSTSNYAGYLEFGTRTKVVIPPEMQDVANEFKNAKSGNWEEFRQSIKDWVKKKGIVPQINGRNAVDPDQEDWDDMIFLIMMSIYKNGISPKPFIYPAFKEGTKDLQKEVDKILERYLNS